MGEKEKEKGNVWHRQLRGKKKQLTKEGNRLDGRNGRKMRGGMGWED
jgi:hypothetical protein